MQPPFDIFLIEPDESVVWRTVVPSLEAAKRYLKELQPPASQEFLIVSLKTGRKARVKPPELDSLTEGSVDS
jgi:hypothetical protein